MLCSKCGTEMPEGSEFCLKCGKKVPVSGVKKNLKPLIFGIIGLFVIAGAILLFMVFNNPLKKFENALANKKYIEASKIYEEKLASDEKKVSFVTEMVQSRIKEITAQYLSQKADYSTSITALNNLAKAGLLTDLIIEAKAEINKFNDSETAYKKGLELQTGKYYIEAMAEFKKVISDDRNYNDAQARITTLLKDYKNEVLRNAEAANTSQDYAGAIKIIDEGLKNLSNDPDLIAKKTGYEKSNQEKMALERKAKMDELFKIQEVSVESVSTYTDWLDDVNLCVIVKNNTDKVVKKYEIAWLGYDDSGYPVKTGWLSPDYLRIGEAEQNIQPGKTFGSGYGWALTGGFDKKTGKKFIACVKDVTYYDDSTWHNPYYDYWVEEYKEKPLH